MNASYYRNAANYAPGTPAEVINARAELEESSLRKQREADADRRQYEERLANWID